MDSHDRWEFPPYFRGHWQSPSTALTAGKCLPLGPCKETLKESMCCHNWKDLFGNSSVILLFSSRSLFFDTCSAELILGNIKRYIYMYHHSFWDDTDIFAQGRQGSGCDTTVGEHTVVLKIIPCCSITQKPSPDSETLTTLLIKAGHKTNFIHDILKYGCKFMSWNVI